MTTKLKIAEREIHWSVIDDYTKCGKFAWFRHVSGMPQAPANPALAYGALWHAEHARRMGRPIDLADECARLLLPDDVAAVLMAEVGRDMDWYFDANPPLQIEPSEAEGELRLHVALDALGVDFTLVGTPDLVGKLELAGGEIAIVDHKTFGVIDKRGYLYPKPSDATLGRYYASKQLFFYAALWTRLHPDQPASVGVYNMIPAHITTALPMAEAKKRKSELRVYREIIPLDPLRCNEVLDQAIVDAGEICLNLKAAEGRSSHMGWRENWHSCVEPWGRCAFWDVCALPQAQRDILAQAPEGRA